MLPVDGRLQESPLWPPPPKLPPCPRCGVLVPLGGAFVTACPHCHTQVALPPELQHARDRFRNERTRVRDPRWARIVAARRHRLFSPLFWAGVAYAAPFVGMFFGYWFGYRNGQLGLATALALWTTGLFHVVCSFVLLARKPQYVRELLTAQQGNPPLCRVCSAPLSPLNNQSNRDGASCTEVLFCDECGADNLHDPKAVVTPRPDLPDLQAAYLEVFGDPVQQRMDRLYPVLVLLGFVWLGGLAWFVIEQ